MNPLGLQELKVVALAVDDMARACDFYRNTLGLVPALEGGEAAFALGNATLMLKLSGNGWPGKPSTELNPRLTLAVADARQTEKRLLARGVRISDGVSLYEEGLFYIGAFLDSEGNKLWFCSAA
ncbi:MAG: VOC family protein [Rhodocyclales bacterium GT-UBC]|nr:MAG: VOC family protein [Rhodocyclales bacterium GT-UBC]